MSQLAGNQKQPAIRFRGFSGDWEIDYLSDRVEFYSGLTYSPDNVNKNGTLVLRSSNVQDGEIYLKDNVYVNHDVVDSDNVNKNDIIVVVRNGSRDLIGKHTIIKNEMPKTVIGAFMTGVRYENSYFLNTVFDTYHFSNAVNRNLGATINQITTGMFKKMGFYFPNSKEQTTIGNFFKQLDGSIALHKRKHQQTQQLKKAMLTKLFPQKGQTQPEIRLQGFYGDWVEKRLGDIVEIVMGQSPNSENYTPNPKDHILVQGNADLHNGKVYPRVWTTEVTKTAVKNDIIMSVRAPVGDIAKTDFSVVLGRGVCAIRGNDFIFYYLFRMKNNGYWSSFSSGSTFESINSNDVKNSVFYMPIEQEQTAIGNFFKQLDDTLALQTQQINTLDNVKKAFLQKMFV